MAIRTTLDNGLTVVFQPQHAARVAAFQIWVRAGSADERPDQAGLAHLHEHMLFKGTARRGPGEVAHAIEANGGEINAWTSFDQTVYHAVIASQFAREALDVLSDAVRNPAFDRDELAREIEVVCEEIKRTQDSPSRRAGRDLFATAFKEHPYHRPVIGWEETVRSFSREKVLEFYHRHYVPSNMVLSVAGDLDESTLQQWVEEMLGGDWGRSWQGEILRPPEKREATRRILIRNEDVKEAYLHLGFPAPSLLDADTPALDVFSMIAGQGEASRLVRELKRGRGLVNSIHASAYTPKDPGVMLASMTLPPEKLDEALTTTVQVLRGLMEEKVAKEELATIQALVESEAVYQRETVQGLARKLGYYQAMAGGLEAEERYYAAVARLTPEQIQEAAQKYLRFDEAIVTALLPNGVSCEEGRIHAALEKGLKERPIKAPARKSPVVSTGEFRITTPVAAQRNAGGLVVHKLSNGAQVIVREESAVPLFAVRATFLGGVRYEAEETSGLTTLVSRLLTRGTTTHDADEITHLIDAYAGSLVGQGGRNSMSVRGEFLSKHFDRAFELFADVVLAPSFRESEFDRERALVLQDIHSREDKPSGVAFDLFHRAIFGPHPYRLPVQGEAASVEQLTPQALRDYHARYMDPSRMTLTVVGDVKADQVIARAEELLGKARGQAAQPPAITPAPPLKGLVKTSRKLPKAQAQVVLGFHGARVYDEWRHSLEMLTTILSGQGGRLFVELRDKRSMAYSVGAFNMDGLEPGYFAGYIGTSPEKVDDALAGIRVEFERIRQEKVTDAELSRARQHLIGVHEIGLQRNGARAAVLGLDFCYGLGDENFFRYADHVSRITTDDVLEVAQKVIDFDAAVLSIVGPNE